MLGVVIKMEWTEICNKYKNQWVLIEAVRAYLKDSKRIIEEINVLFESGDDSRDALLKYKEIHKQDPERELYVVHTSREKIDINEKFYVGVRPHA